MLKKYILLCLFFCLPFFLKAQQYGLFNTKTLFDGFENPAQKTFVLDSSRKFASNFFLPYFGLSGANKGNSDLIRRAINEGKYNAANLPLRTGAINTVHENTNIYLLTFRIFQSYKWQKEMGFSWQLRSDGHVDYTNETLAILDSYQRFDTNPYDDVFNNDGYAQSYHQFSMTYRENYNKRLAFGVKLSLLSGITYNKLNISDSYFLLDPANDLINVRVKGSYRASFVKTNELSTHTLVPTFRNPGMAFSFGTSYNAKSGVFLMANIKDLGFIKWRKSAYINKINAAVNIQNLSQKSSNQIRNEIADIATDESDSTSFFSPTNAKIDFMLSKAFTLSTPDFTYTPSLIVSKNLFFKGGDAAFVNKFKYRDLAISAIPSYNFNNLFFMGLQGLYQTPNFEIFLGSDNLFKTVTQINGAVNRDATIGNGYNGASFYMGLGFKFGNTVEHPQNSSTMPGIGDEKPGFFKRLFSVFSKKK
ncbi:DUF5723 family protein [Pedobacter heparinus]|uniref:DUF5723 domain-containing protein n=1 Tax=Pedobacter heparinus (strain ATCC 13125 / DSM 2366 / CIP 104194 / JCM 7457 / NBRC 12017 / NCIMB 9290 / NRRL B-14731 / HIM 762-3) TaxID=485917 RepID=C6XTX4_PEDHD|nr:DUF5723 family protein [Pedobacter heparinus]ACU03760.1 hypothetical protein Phep_1547 [Pedobacter heparinus DSM 2366]